MKTKRNKRVLSGLFALALLATTAVGVAESKKSEAKMSDLTMANVEALANGEVGIGVPCMHTCEYCWCYIPPIEVDPYDYWVEHAEPYL